jgi:uncharacterized pyridoxal phosphate-containing UPF0001 family protein
MFWRAPIDDAYIESVRERLAIVRSRIASAGGDEKAVRIVAVTKGFDERACLAALSLGVADLGENYADELLQKAVEPDLLKSTTTARWHFLGGIQRRKVARLVHHVALFQGVDRLEEGEAIARHAPGASVLIEVDTTGQPRRGGVVPKDVEKLLGGLLRLGLNVTGLMTIAAPGEPEAARKSFGCVSGLASTLGLKECSMGMSEDLEDAVAAGATIVRVGRGLFGPRPA